jgi:flagellar protein FliO/FliZ
MDSLFGEGTSLPVRFFIAFVVVFALIGVTAWLIRRFGSGALGGAGARGRAPRLAVIEAGAVDGRRKLVLIRRDNIEHLIMIGGPTDIVVEANIVRGQNAREAASSRVSSVTEALPRTLPAEETAWPLQPEAAPRQAARASKPAPLEETAHWALPPEPAPPPPPAPPPAPAKRSRSADTLAGLAAELSVRPSEPAIAPPPAPAPRPAPAVEAPRAKTAAAPAASAAADQNLADMASRLEAALRRPSTAPAPPPAPAPRPAAAPKSAAETPRAAPPVAPPIAPPAPPVAQEPAQQPAPATAPIVTIEPDAKPAEAKAAKTDDVFGSIEQEMANLLGRPSGKPS